jgi:hypothetical protein
MVLVVLKVLKVRTWGSESRVSWDITFLWLSVNVAVDRPNRYQKPPNPRLPSTASTFYHYLGPSEGASKSFQGGKRLTSFKSHDPLKKKTIAY